jgi:hypothetical protein
VNRRVVLVTAAVILACARPFPPPGGEQIRLPPQIIATTPAPLSSVTPSNDAVVFRFDRTLSERGITDASALVSPATGETRVDRKGNTLRVRVEGGWQPGIVYRVVLLPGLRDRFNNESREPAQLVFSTGPEIPPGAIAGLALDRITGAPAENVLVEAKSRADSLIYQTVPDTGAFFALQHLGVGSYDVRAYQDRNRSRTLDVGEGASRGTVITVNRANDTLTAVLTIVPWDTTPAVVEDVQALDTLQIRVTMNEYFEAENLLESAEVSLFTLPDSTPVPGNLRVLTTATFDSLRAAADSARAAADSARADTTRADTAAALPPRPPARPPRAPAPRAAQPGRRPGRAGSADPELLLPIREFVVIPPVPLVPGGSYQLRVEQLTNISGVARGGGRRDFTVPERPDTASAQPPAARGGDERRR